MGLFLMLLLVMLSRSTKAITRSMEDEQQLANLLVSMKFREEIEGKRERKRRIKKARLAAERLHFPPCFHIEFRLLSFWQRHIGGNANKYMSNTTSAPGQNERAPKAKLTTRITYWLRKCKHERMTSTPVNTLSNTIVDRTFSVEEGQAVPNCLQFGFERV